MIADKCQGHGRCWAVAPDLFEPDDLGNAHEVDGGTVPPGAEQQAQLAVDNFRSSPSPSPATDRP